MLQNEWATLHQEKRKKKERMSRLYFIRKKEKERKNEYTKKNMGFQADEQYLILIRIYKSPHEIRQKIRMMLKNLLASAHVSRNLTCPLVATEDIKVIRQDLTEFKTSIAFVHVIAQASRNMPQTIES